MWGLSHSGKGAEVADAERQTFHSLRKAKQAEARPRHPLRKKPESYLLGLTALISEASVGKGHP